MKLKTRFLTTLLSTSLSMLALKNEAQAQERDWSNLFRKNEKFVPVSYAVDQPIERLTGVNNETIGYDFETKKLVSPAREKVIFLMDSAAIAQDIKDNKHSLVEMSNAVLIARSFVDWHNNIHENNPESRGLYPRSPVYDVLEIKKDALSRFHDLVKKSPPDKKLSPELKEFLTNKDNIEKLDIGVNAKDLPGYDANGQGDTKSYHLGFKKKHDL